MTFVIGAAAMTRSLALLLAPAAWLVVLAVPVARAQVVDEQLWSQANAIVALSQQDSVTLESIARFGDAADGLAHTEFGGFFTHKPSKRVELALGYRHVQDYDHGRPVPNEERLRQMVTVALGAGLSGRLRFEQRFSSGGPAIGLRLRPRLGLDLPLSQGGLRLFATQEHFWNLNRTGWGQRRGYERVRHTLGLSFPLGEKLRADAGYLNEFRPGSGARRDSLTHAATLALNLTL
jgi:hypothetical protein